MGEGFFTKTRNSETLKYQDSFDKNYQKWDINLEGGGNCNSGNKAWISLTYKASQQINKKQVKNSTEKLTKDI